MKLSVRKMISVGLTAVMVITSGLFLTTSNIVWAETNIDDAVSIEVGEEIEDSILEKTEEDWYTFTTSATETGADSWFKISQMYSNKKENGYPPSIYLYDDKEKELLNIIPTGENEEELGYIILEQDSTYYVKVLSPYHNDTADYRFSVTELGDEAGETMEKAPVLDKNTTNRFEMQSYDDEDWFNVESDIAKPTLTVKNANVFSLTVVIYDIDGIKLEEFGVDKSESETVKLNLEDKNFYIRIYSYYSTDECVGNYTVAVNDEIIVTKVSLNKSTAELKKGKSVTLKATITPDSAIDKSVTWKSSNTKIATVDKKGKVVAKKSGVVTITCTANDSSKKKATCKITVK